MEKMSGFALLGIYIVAVGTGSFLQKYVMDKVTPFQLEVMTALGMFAVSVPALFLAQKNLNIPLTSQPLAWLVGILFAVGSFTYVIAVSKLPLSIASPLSLGYVVVAVTLSTIFLSEPITFWKATGIALAIIGITILSIQPAA